MILKSSILVQFMFQFNLLNSTKLNHYIVQILFSPPSSLSFSHTHIKAVA